jgi:branched-chain amino acid transport system permease protein
VAALVGLLVGLPSLRLRGDYLAIVTLGFGEIVRVVLTRSGDVLLTPEEVAQTSVWARMTHTGGALGFNGLPFYTNLFWVYLFVGATVIVAYRLKMSSYGRAFLAIREDEAAAESMGVPVFRYKVRAFVVAAFFAGVAGALFAHEVGTTLNPRELGFMKSIEVVIMVVLGGMGSISGAILAAIILAILPEALRAFSEWRMVIYSVILIAMMLLRPKGLFGIYELWDWNWLRRITGRRPLVRG